MAVERAMLACEQKRVRLRSSFNIQERERERKSLPSRKVEKRAERSVDDDDDQTGELRVLLPRTPLAASACD